MNIMPNIGLMTSPQPAVDAKAFDLGFLTGIPQAISNIITAPQLADAQEAAAAAQEASALYAAQASQARSAAMIKVVSLIAGTALLGLAAYLIFR